jgi:hypothetical protein
MKTRLHLWLPFVAGLIVLTACSEDPIANADEPGYVVLKYDDADPDQMKGEPGAYAMTARGHESAPLAVVDVPAGFTNFGFFAMWPQESASEVEPFQAIQYWTVYGVHSDPCEHQGAAPEIGDSVEKLAEALDAQELTEVSEPQPVSLDGHDGLYVELTVPSYVRTKSCGLGYYTVWDGALNDQQHTADAPGSVDRLWILDVNGARVVLAAITGPGATDAQAETLADVVTSVHFVEPT